MKPKYQIIAVLLVAILIAGLVVAVLSYENAKDASDKVDRERAARVLANCERGNKTNEGVLNFIKATTSAAPLRPISSGDPTVDRAIAMILAQANANSASRNQAIANAQAKYFPIIDCKTGNVVSPK